MKEWFITGADLCGIIVKAESFDDAIAQARKINSAYTSGKLYGGLSNA